MYHEANQYNLGHSFLDFNCNFFNISTSTLKLQLEDDVRGLDCLILFSSLMCVKKKPL
jgi:hypothetical protein